MGRVVAGLQQGEVGWRVSVPDADCETTLVLALDERWYADLPLEGEGELGSGGDTDLDVPE